MIAKEVAKGLLAVNAVTLSAKEPYTWASGLKSPIYCDNRITLSYPALRRLIAKGLATLIKESYPEAEIIVGTAIGGIPQACWIADILELPLAYVRPQPKNHGQGKQVEGNVPKGAKVVLIEDLISTGGSVLKAVDALRQAGAEVLGVVGVFSYELEKAIKNFSDAKVELHTLSNYNVLINVAQEEGTISEEELNLLKIWRRDPDNYEANLNMV